MNTNVSYNGTNATLNQLVATFKIIAERHAQINSFFQGDAWDITSETVQNYPLLAVTILPANFEYITIQYNFRVYVLDLVDQNRKNELEVQSDTIRILWDVRQWLETVFDLDVVTSGTANPVAESLDDYVAGWYLDIGIITPQEIGPCDVPCK